MGLFVNTNVSALNAQRQLFDVGNSLSTSFERLSSGFRINSAADDAAGLQISDRTTSQIQGLNQAVRNANDAISLAQTAEGALNETTTALQRIRQLAVQSQNGINSSADRVALQAEVGQLLNELSRIASDTQFGGLNILSGGFSSAFLVGANAGQTISINLSSSDGASFGASGLGVGTSPGVPLQGIEERSAWQEDFSACPTLLRFLLLPEHIAGPVVAIGSRLPPRRFYGLAVFRIRPAGAEAPATPVGLDASPGLARSLPPEPFELRQPS